MSAVNQPIEPLDPSEGAGFPRATEFSDESLARRAQGGCAASLDQLIRRYQTPLLRFLRRRVSSAGDAEDVLQETLVRAVRRLDRYDPGQRFSAWIFTIAYRQAVSHHRRQTPPSPRALRGLAERHAERSPPGPLPAAAREEIASRLWELAARVLTADQFVAAWLYYVEGLDTHDLSRVMGRSWVSAKVLLFRARAKLAPFLREWADAADPATSSDDDDGFSAAEPRAMRISTGRGPRPALTG